MWRGLSHLTELRHLNSRNSIFPFHRLCRRQCPQRERCGSLGHHRRQRRQPADRARGLEHRPRLSDLKQDLLDARSSHDSQVARIDGWLDNLHVRGSARPPAVKGRSQAAPKLIRRQAEWRYPALSDPFLSTS
jgi:hypothetical protein